MKLDRPEKGYHPTAPCRFIFAAMTPRRLAVLLWLGASLAVGAADHASQADARRLYLKGRYEEAIEAYEALQEEQRAASALGLAGCYRETGRRQQAEAVLRAAGEREPENADLAAGLALLAWQRGDWEQARQRAETALRRNDRQLAARWISAELHRVSGRLDEARRGYQWLLDDFDRHRPGTAEELRWTGLAAAQLARWNRNSGQFRSLVNTFWPQALAREPDFWPARLEMALLFLEKYNAGDARTQLDAALAINPAAAPVHAARAALALQDFDLPTARRALEQALAIDPQCLPAHQCLADTLLAELHVDEAVEALETARRLNPRDEATLGRLAAAYAAADGPGGDGEDARLAGLIRDVTARNPHCGEFFLALADGLDRMRRYPDAAAYYRQAQQRMPQLLYTRGQWGLVLMRLGEETEARRLLEDAFRDDPFHVRVRNQLEVLDVLDDYAVLETEHFVVKYDAQHDEMLARYAARYLEQEVYSNAVAAFGFAPPQKSLIEIFSAAQGVSGHGWFSARMTGLPFIGTVGACAGQIAAITSPGEVREKFNWARVLRHEYAHVVTLQQTGFAIPHWYTEALAVRFEGGRRPVEWTEILRRRANADRLLNLDTINLAFIRPQDKDERILAYCQAELYAEFMAARYGEDAPRRLLEAYADNLDTPAAIHHCFGVELAEFERAYRAYVGEVVAGGAEFASETPETVQKLKSAAAVYLRTGEKTKLRDALRQLAEFDDDHWLYRKKLLLLAIEAGDFADAVRWATETLHIDVNDAEAHALLGRALGQLRQYARATEELETAVGLAPQRADWQAWLADVRLQADQTGETRRTSDRDPREDECPPER